MDNYGIKVSKEGKKIDSDNPLDYYLNSAHPNIFTSKVGTGTHLFNDSSYGVGTVNITTIRHGLGYKPSYISYLTDNAVNYTYLPLWYASYTAGDLSWYTDTEIDAYCDKENFYIDFVKTATGSPPSNNTAWKDMAGISFNFKYYIFANQVN